MYRGNTGIHHLYSATLLKDPAALYNKGDININQLDSKLKKNCKKSMKEPPKIDEF